MFSKTKQTFWRSGLGGWHIALDERDGSICTLSMDQLELLVGCVLKQKEWILRMSLRQLRYSDDLNNLSPHLYMNKQIVAYIHEFCILVYLVMNQSWVQNTQ